MTYQQVTHFAETWGLVLAVVLFLCAVVYALWPANRSKFNRAARVPLDQEDYNGDA